jgi:hypothetical protein
LWHERACSCNLRWSNWQRKSDLLRNNNLLRLLDHSLLLLARRCHKLTTFEWEVRETRHGSLSP